MSRIVYVNGDFVPEADAKISVFDRGFLFADGVYEVSSVLEGQLIDNAAHLARLRRSLSELNMPSPATDEDIVAAQKALVEKNNLTEGMVYLQATRGAADRDFAFPKEPKPTLIMFTQAMNVLQKPGLERGYSVITTEDLRWKRRDIKTVGLLAPSMAKQMAVEAGADDTWMVENGYVTEGTSNNAYIVTGDGTIITRHLSNEILHGITRRAVLSIANELNLRVEERPFTVEEAKAASEAFVTSATAFVFPVTRLDGTPIGAGVPGPVTLQLRKRYIELALEEARAEAARHRPAAE